MTETLASFFAVSSITTSPGSALVSSNLSTGTAVVAVPAAADSSGAVVVSYRNVPVVGHLEICKNNAADANLTGSFTFTITGPAGSGFTATVLVPIGHCSFPIAVPAGTDTVTEETPNSISSITVQNGAPSTTNTTTGTATVTVKPDVAPGDTSQETIVTFFDETVNLKICKIASDAGVTSPYTFTVSATEPAGGNTVPNRTVTVLPGQCQLVPGPYTNPNGTTGWRAGTRVTIAEGIVPGTAVTAISVVPASAEIGPRLLSPLPNPSLPGPAGSDVVALAPGETQVSFTNDTVPGGTLKICENPDPKAPATAVETFTVSQPGTTAITTVAVPFGSCTIAFDPATADGRWPYNSAVTIAQNPSVFGFLSVAVSPAARLLTPPGPTIQVAIGSGDTTIATYTNDPPGSGASGGSGSPASASVPGSITIGGATVIAAVSGTTAPAGSAAAASHTQLRMARLIKVHGHVYLVIRVASTSKSATVRIVELNKRGQKITAFKATIATNRNVRLAIPVSRQLRIAEVKLA